MNRLILVLGAALSTVSCSGTRAAGPTTVGGAVARATYASPPRAVVATSGRGAEIRAALSPDGVFSLRLPKGHRYALAVETSAGRVPIAMPRRSGRLDRTFVVSSDGVAVALGAIRYRAAGTAIPFAAAGTCDPNGSGEYACVQDDEQSTCEDGQQGANDQTGNDGECVNGVDTTTHAACTDPAADDAEQLDAKVEMAVPERSAPADASGCGGDGED